MILITGGAGFIGSVLAQELNAQGREDIILVDRIGESTKWKHLRETKFARYVHADDLFNLSSFCLDDVSFIFHMGACSDTTEVDMDYLIQNNLEYSQKLFLHAIEKDIPMVYASSAATYGAGELGYSDDHEEIPGLKPLNRYGFSKQLFDEWVLKLERWPTHWFGLKFFNVYGPNEEHKQEMRSLVHKAYEQILESGSVKLFKSHRDDFENGMQLRDFVYAKDVARAMIEMMAPEKAEASGIYNMGTGQARSFLDLVKATFKAMERPENIEFIDMPLHLRDQYQYYTQAQMTKFHQSFDGFEFTSLEQAVADTVQNHLQKRGL